MCIRKWNKNKKNISKKKNYDKLVYKGGLVSWINLNGQKKNMINQFFKKYNKNGLKIGVTQGGTV